MNLSQKLKQYRLSETEYQKICGCLGRPPKDLEWALFSALWSEHCSYKSSRIHLKKFAKTLNETVVSAHGENAGVIDLGLGERIAFKMESHNHPSFIEPYQGAATGVGGILRDIFTMGARPIAIADYLCFGMPSAERMPQLMDGVVRGISGYGNCVGVPTVTGQTNFHESYNENILVNAMAVGLLRPGEKIALSKAQGPGNLVVYVGAKTGKDGVHGAAMASESFDENSEAKKPNVQIGDPFFEKLLIESCLQVIQEDLVVAIQDMGAAGLTSSSFEMSSKGQVGMELYLDQVPVRDSSITPEEILLSESQERMLLVCEPGKLKAIQAHFERWGLDAAVIGHLIPQRLVKLFWKKECLISIDPDVLVENAPVYERPYRAWEPLNQRAALELKSIDAKTVQSWIEQSLNSEIAASRKPIYRQYDQRVGAATARGAESDIAILKLQDSGRGLAMAVGCRPQVLRLDARLGGFDSVYYPALQMALKGARAVAVTDCLNFGNPEKMEIMSEFVASVEAIAEAAVLLKAPVISGNVSFYNETMGRNITSTPATGMVGLRPNVDNIPLDRFEEAGLTVFWIQGVGPKSSGLYGEKQSKSLNFQGEFKAQTQAKYMESILEICSGEGVQTSKAVSGGGLGLTLARMCLSGFGLTCSNPVIDADFVTERFYDVVLATRTPDLLKEKMKQAFSKMGLNPVIVELGKTGGDLCKLSSEIKFSIPRLRQDYDSGLQPYFQGVGPA